MFQKLAEINTSTHQAQVARTHLGNLSVFKCNGDHCDWDILPDAYHASDYLIEQLPAQYYRVEFGDDEEWHPIICKAYK